MSKETLDAGIIQIFTPFLYILDFILYCLRILLKRLENIFGYYGGELLLFYGHLDPSPRYQSQVLGHFWCLCERNDFVVIEIVNGREIEVFLVIRNISNFSDPPLIRTVRMELSVQQIIGYHVGLLFTIKPFLLADLCLYAHLFH